MLNNKKSFLQRARIAMVAIVTIISVGGAFASTNHHNKALQTWGVLQTNASTYVVTAITTGSLCGNAPLRVCEVKSMATPDPVTHTIPKSGTSNPIAGAFQK